MTARPQDGLRVVPVAGLEHGLLEDGAAGAEWLALRTLAPAFWAQRVRIGACALLGAALALGLAFVLPPIYIATCVVLEAPHPGGGSALDQLGLSAEALGLKAGGSGGNALTYPDILRSRRLLEALLAQRFRAGNGETGALIDHVLPGKPSPQRTELALKRLREHIDVALDRRTNLLRVGVSDRDPQLAAAVANAACAGLQDIVMRQMMTQAGATRRFVEQQLAEAEIDLASAEGALAVFRSNNLHVDGSPYLALEQTRLAREARTHEEIVLALTRQFETAKVDERRDVPVLNVLDTAVPPAFKSAPRPGLMAAAGLMLGLVAGLAWSWPRLARAAAERAEAA